MDYPPSLRFPLGGIEQSFGHMWGGLLYLTAIFRRQGSTHRKPEISLELIFRFLSDDNAVDPILSTDESKSEIGHALAPEGGRSAFEPVNQPRRIDAGNSRPN